MAIFNIKILISPRELTPKYLDEKINTIKLIIATMPLVATLFIIFLNKPLLYKISSKIN